MKSTKIMSKPFKKLRGYRVYLVAPPVPTGKIELSSQTKKSVQKDLVTEFIRLKVYAVGDSVTDIKEGDEVLVQDFALNNAPYIELTKDLTVILINVNDIVHVW